VLPPPERLTVGQFLQRWLADVVRPRVRATTYEGYERLVRRHLEPSLGRRPLAKLSPADVAACYRALLDQGLAPRTVEYAHAVLHRALRDAERWGLVARNVASLTDPPRPQPRPATTLDAAQARQLLAAARGERLEALYVLALTTGLRLGELLALRWADIDWAAGALHVQRTVVRTRQGVQFHPPKTARGRRRVPLGPLALRALRAHRKRQHAERLRLGPLWAEQDLVFPNAVGRPIERQNLVRRDYRIALAAVGRCRPSPARVVVSVAVSRRARFARPGAPPGARQPPRIASGGSRAPHRSRWGRTDALRAAARLHLAVPSEPVRRSRCTARARQAS